MPSNTEAVEALRWRKVPCLDDGFVCLVDAMGDDQAVVQAARVSYGQDQREGGEAQKSDRALIRYMFSHAHGTPFEMCQIKMLLRIPMDAWRQFVRHRTLSINEYSTRYTEAIDSAQQTSPGAWRLQSVSNKQGSAGILEDWPEGWSCDEHGTVHGPDKYSLSVASNDIAKPGQFLSHEEASIQQQIRRIYEQRLALGVAREQARKDLPLSTYTEAYVCCDLRNIFHFLGLRMDSHAQQEIREYATAIGEQIIKPLFPLCWEAFEDYQLHACSFSRIEMQLLRAAFNRQPVDDIAWPEDLSARERGEFLKKLGH